MTGKQSAVTADNETVPDAHTSISIKDGAVHVRATIPTMDAALKLINFLVVTAELHFGQEIYFGDDESQNESESDNESTKE
jgi:hypothetical protein